MQCVEFDRRINELLDGGQAPVDPALWEHAERCAACASLFDGYQALEHAISQLPEPRPGRDLSGGALKSARPERRGLRAVAGAAGLAAAVGLVMLVPRQQADNSPPRAPSLAQLRESKPVASPSEVFLEAGQSWWSATCETAQPLASAPELLARPNLDAITEALKYDQTDMVSWEQLGRPLSDATFEAAKIFRTIPRIPNHPSGAMDSSS